MNKRMKWDAEAAFKSLDAQGKRRQASIDDERLKTTPYTPPPNVAAWLQAQADKPKAGRDIASLMRYHEAHKRGRTDDDCLREKFGGQPLPSASTKPHGKDVDTADGPWPRYFIPTDPSQSAACIFVDAHTSDVFWRGFTNKDRRLVTHNALPEAGDERWSEVNVSAFAQWLEQNGHKDVAAQLRGKDAAGGGRVWTGILGNDVAAKRACVLIGGIGYCRVRGNWHYLGEQKGEPTGERVELFGPERDAIIAECRKAMGL